MTNVWPPFSCWRARNSWRSSLIFCLNSLFLARSSSRPFDTRRSSFITGFLSLALTSPAQRHCFVLFRLRSLALTHFAFRNCAVLFGLLSLVPARSLVQSCCLLLCLLILALCGSISLSASIKPYLEK